METPDVVQGLWLGPLQNGIYLGLICMDTISRYNKTKKSYRRSEERTLLLIDEEALCSQRTENSTEVLKM
jgi:hypothetical protein